MKSLQPAWVSFDKQGSMKITFNKNPVRFPHKMRGEFCYKRSRENRREREGEPGQKVLTISSQPGCRNSGKNGGKILFQNETRALKSHEKMSGKMRTRYEQDLFQRNGGEHGLSAETRAYSPITQRLHADYSLTARRRRRIR